MASSISNNIAEVKNSRQEVQDLNASLEKKVSLRTQQLKSKNAELASTIENLEQTRESLVQSEKMASLGAIVAGVAHELNTPIGNALTVSTTQTEKSKLFSKEIETGLKRSSLIEYVENTLLAADLIQRNLMRASELVQSFKQVAADQSSEQKRKFNLKETINEHLLMLHMTIKNTPYKIDVAIPSELSMNSYPGPLGQVITNFVNNSILHGFDGREHGLIRISAEAIDKTSLRLVYTDDGKGISAKNLHRIFEPFFTTRLGQGGSGLGLNIVFNIVTKLLGGKIHSKSKLGKGVTFELILPFEAPIPSADKETRSGETQ
jgi:signal transduction histidine kinase